MLSGRYLVAIIQCVNQSHDACCCSENCSSYSKNSCRWIVALPEVSYLHKKSCCAFHVVNVNLFLFQQNMDIYRRSKLSEQELEALELREREVSVEMSR